jgi:deazaflavin-dependent oxidoreductase (nitroreductase family)
MMAATIESALRSDNLIDMTTFGRKSGQPHRIEIAFHNLDGTIYITGLPGKRDWYANLVAHPQFTLHLKESIKTDLPATAVPVTDEPTRRRVMTHVVAKWNRQDQLEAFVNNSPLVEVRFEGP